MSVYWPTATHSPSLGQDTPKRETASGPGTEFEGGKSSIGVGKNGAGVALKESRSGGGWGMGLEGTCPV